MHSEGLLIGDFIDVSLQKSRLYLGKQRVIGAGVFVVIQLISLFTVIELLCLKDIVIGFSCT